MKEGRTSFDNGFGDKFTITLDGEMFVYGDCWIYAEIGNLLADIHETVLKPRDGRFIRLTIVSEDEGFHPYGIKKGWYSGRFIDATDAAKIRESWAVLRSQPDDPSPW